MRIRWTFFVGLFVVLLAAPVVVAGAYGYWMLQRAMAGISRVDGLVTAEEIDGEPILYLIVGSDSRDAPQFAVDQEFVSGQRADVIIVLILDPRRPAAVLLSIPRDTLVDIPGSGQDKINHAFAEGAQLMVDTVAAFMGMPIHHYVQMDFVGFMSLVEAVGGVPLCFEHPVRDTQVGLDLSAGCHQLNGITALQYVRSRQFQQEIDGFFVFDPTADFGRILRQQHFLRALFASTAEVRNLPRVPAYVSAVSDTIFVDPAFSDGDAVTLARRFARFDPAALFQVSLPGVTTGLIGGVSFVLPTAETLAWLDDLRSGRHLPGEPGRGVALADVALVVSNGNGVPGCADIVAGRLREAGANVVGLGDAGRFDVEATEVRHNPGEADKANVVMQALGAGVAMEVNRPGPEVEVVVGADLAGECGA